MNQAGSKAFGFWTLTFLVIANMVGAGVFTTSGFTLAALGNPWLVLVAWLVAGAIALCGALSYGMLVERMPLSGGEYLFLSKSGFPLAGFIAGWVSLLAGFSGAIAFAALALEDHLPAGLPEKVPAVLIVIFGGVLHGRKRLVGSMTQNAAVLLKLILLAAIIIWSASCLGSLEWQGLQNKTPVSGSQTPEFAKSLVWISLSYSGFNAAVYVAGESRSPRLIQHALFTGTLIVLVFYLVLNAFFVLGPPADLINGEPDVAALAAGWIGGREFEIFVRIVISLALLTSVLGMMMAGPRVYGKMAEDGMLPRLFILKPDRTGPAVFLQMTLALFLILAGNLRDLLGYLGLTLSLSAAISVMCLFRRREGKNLKGWRLLPPVVFVGATMISAALLVWQEPRQAAATAITLVIGATGYLLIRRNSEVANP